LAFTAWHKGVMAAGLLAVSGLTIAAFLGGHASGTVSVPLAPPLPSPTSTTMAEATPASDNDPAPPAAVAAAPVALLVDLGSDRTLYEHNADQPFLPASVTKTMTAFVAFEMLAKGELREDQTFKVSREAWREWHSKGSRMFLSDGSQVPVRDLLLGIMNVSANDGAIVLAEGAGGSVAGFVARMNATAKELGMTHSHFGTPNGWMDKGVTHVSASDLVKLSDAMIHRHPDYYHRYVGQKGMTWNGITQPNHDPTLGIVEGADGIKTGFTGEAHYNFLGSAVRGKRRLVMVLAGVETPKERTAAAKALLEWGFNAWEDKPLVPEGTPLSSAAVQGGMKSEVKLEAPRDFYVTLPKGGHAPVSMRLVYHGPLVAPIVKGTTVAELEVQLGKNKPVRLPVTAAEDVAKGGFIERVKTGFARLIAPAPEKAPA
jgi:D-alanyl-D-alanine carboxypeptidase (penicillin-binding protein 5/6)